MTNFSEGIYSFVSEDGAAFLDTSRTGSYSLKGFVGSEFVLLGVRLSSFFSKDSKIGLPLENIAY